MHGVNVTERAIHLEMVEIAYFLHYVHFIMVEKGRGREGRGGKRRAGEGRGGESGEERREGEREQGKEGGREREREEPGKLIQYG